METAAGHVQTATSALTPDAAAARRHGRRCALLLAGGALALPAAVLAVLLVIPMLLFARYSFDLYVAGGAIRPAWTLVNYRKFVTDPFYLAILVRTAAMAAAATGITLVLSFPIAYYLARLRSRWKSALVMLIIFPLLVGNVNRSIGWIALFSDTGVINRLLIMTGLVVHPLRLLYTPLAVTIAVASVNMPFVVLPLQASIEGIDRAVEEAARNLGANAWQVFRQVVLPLSVPGIAAGTILSFVLAINAYATPALVGGPRVLMMVPALYEQVQEVGDWPFGAAMAVILTVFTLVTSAVYLRWIQGGYLRVREREMPT